MPEEVIFETIIREYEPLCKNAVLVWQSFFCGYLSRNNLVFSRFLL